MNNTRICLLGLPRCGSQYISEIITNSLPDFNMQNLGEPFTFRDKMTLIRKENNILSLTSELKDSNSHSTQIDEVINLLKNGSPDQSLLLKLFLNFQMYPFLSRILNELRTLNFKFLVIKRENIENHLLSWLVATTTDKWYSAQGAHKEYVHINEDCLSRVAFLHKAILNFDNVLFEHNIDCEVIRYEYAIEDLTTYLPVPLKTDSGFEKQLPNNPYDIIQNKEEVQTWIKNLMSKSLNG